MAWRSFSRRWFLPLRHVFYFFRLVELALSPVAKAEANLVQHSPHEQPSLSSSLLEPPGQAGSRALSESSTQLDGTPGEPALVCLSRHKDLAPRW